MTGSNYLVIHFITMKKLAPLILFQLIIFLAAAQNPRVELLTSGSKTSLRGLSVVNDNIVWVSGSNGIVGRSTNGGKNWKWVIVKGFEKNEFRDIEAFDGSTALIMAVGEPAYILKTIDGGDSWKVVYENKTKGMFLDAMDFANNQMGIVIGDPINGKVFIARTDNTGNTWQETAQQAVANSGEAFFAASGSNVRLFANEDYYVVSGGSRSRLITNSSIIDLPIIQGKESTGANSIDIFDDGIPKRPGDHMVIVGGDFNADSSSTKNCFFSTNGGKTWKAPKTPPHGYRSCVEYLSKKDILACGPNGIDYSSDGGKTWKWISKEGFHVCRIARVGTAVFLAGTDGKIARMLF
jgi:photosystem II stability/assembly factor-like uncharacterized protein